MTNQLSRPPTWRNNPGHRRWLTYRGRRAFSLLRARIDRSRRRLFGARRRRPRHSPREPRVRCTPPPAWRIVSPSACCSAGPAPPTLSTTRWRRSGRAIGTPRRRLFLVVRRRRPRRARQARLWPRLRPARRLQRQARRPPRRRPADRRHLGNSRDGAFGTRPPARAPKNSTRIGRLSATIAARTPTCI